MGAKQVLLTNHPETDTRPHGMNDRPINVLLIEDEPGDARLVREILAYADSHQFNLECTDRLSAGLERLARGGIDVVLLDLGLPDSRGLDTLAALHALESAVPVVVETGLDDEALALEAVQSGAQDYLIKGHFSHDVLARTIRYAIERKHAERALRESEHRAVSMLEELKVTQESLIQAEKLSAIGELVAGVAHELNNPLSTIVGFAELLLTRDPEPEARQYLERIQSDGWRAARVVANLRTFAQKREVQATVLDVNEVLTDVLKLKSYSLKVSTIQVEEDLAADLPMVLADKGQLQIVFLNLINNAQNAMEEANGRGTLWIKTAQVGGNVRVTVADGGPGIKPENLSKIFDPFFTTKDGGKGMGLGLSICQGIATRHNGRIWVEGEYGKGATFHLELPATQEVLTVSDCSPETEAAATQRAARILIIDDEEGTRELLKEVLSGLGHDVKALERGREALALPDITDYDLLLVDVKMPDMNGMVFFQELSKTAPEVMARVVFVTGDIVNSATQEFLEMTGRSVLAKPFDLQTLTRVVAEELRKRY